MVKPIDKIKRLEQQLEETYQIWIHTFGPYEKTMFERYVAASDALDRAKKGNNEARR